LTDPPPKKHKKKERLVGGPTFPRRPTKIEYIGLTNRRIVCLYSQISERKRFPNKKGTRRTKRAKYGTMKSIVLYFVRFFFFQKTTKRRTSQCQ